MTHLPHRPTAPFRVGVSQCLVGDVVRYDATDAAHELPETLKDTFEWHPICPEVGIGMSVPRDPIRLVGSVDSYRVQGVEDPEVDKTDALMRYADEVTPQCAQLAGYVFMHNSPSCGLYTVKVYASSQDEPVRAARGRFAKSLTHNLPALPVEEAAGLHDAHRRANFVMRAQTYAHWLVTFGDLSAERLIAFHSMHKYLLMAHSNEAYRCAGHLLSNLKFELPYKAQQYIELLMQGLSTPASRVGHANALSHLQGYLKRHLSAQQRQALHQLIHAFRRGEVALSEPMSELRSYFSRYPNDYAQSQVYLTTEFAL